MRRARLLPLLALFGFATPLPAGTLREIVGTWRGTSICVKSEANQACHDEQVQYDFAPSQDEKGAVVLDAKKLVGGTYQSMGELVFRYDEGTHRWAAKIQTRGGRDLWSFAVRGDALTGTLVTESGTLLRNAQAKRVPVSHTK